MPIQYPIVRPTANTITILIVKNIIVVIAYAVSSYARLMAPLLIVTLENKMATVSHVRYLRQKKTGTLPNYSILFPYIYVALNSGGSVVDAEMKRYVV